MSTIKAQTLKGFRDFLPIEARKRQYVIDILKKVFESYGFEPLETPALEYEEVLLGKYGEEGDKLMYRFEDLGKRKVALRYDQTVPLARVVAQYGNQLSMPFKRYQIQPVWRAENTQKGRYREFLQCDADSIGINSPLADSEIIALAVKSVEKLGFKNYKVLINDRGIFSKLTEVIEKDKILGIIRSLDKIKKIGREGVLNELIDKGFEIEKATYILQIIEQAKPTVAIEKIFSLLKKLDIDSSKIGFSPTLARGLDYYTSTIFEIEIEGYEAGSVCGGGRYDNLIGMFAGKQIPAVGFAFGFDRLIEAIDQLDLFPKDLQTTKVLVTIFSQDLLEKSLETVSILRNKGINTEIFPEETASLEKQLKYADKKGVPYAIIAGPEEVKTGKVILKDLKKRTQVSISIDELTIN